jgi:hypothetical protein
VLLLLLLLGLGLGLGLLRLEALRGGEAGHQGRLRAGAKAGRGPGWQAGGRRALAAAARVAP